MTGMRCVVALAVLMWPLGTVLNAEQDATAAVWARLRASPHPSGLRYDIEREVVRLQGKPDPARWPPRRPRQSNGKGRCSALKGIGVGAGIGGGVGALGGAVTSDPSDFGGRAFPAMVYGVFGATLGSIVGYIYCRQP